MPSLPSPFKSKPAKPQPFSPLASTNDALIRPTLSAALAVAGFEAFEPNPQYGFKPAQRTGKQVHGMWNFVEPTNAPPVPGYKQLPDVFQRVFEKCWKVAEPSAERGRFLVGTRGMDFPNQAAVLSQNYRPEVRPSRTNIDTVFPNKDAIASDWSQMQSIERKNAVAFRGDGRSPQEVIVKCNGFTPPITRTDDNYLYDSDRSVFVYFNDYLQRRYNRKITKAEFLAAVKNGAPFLNDKKLLIEYTRWRALLQRESAHLGRMVENEVDKGWISCSKSIDSSRAFACDTYNRPGWLYLVVVHGGFVVPDEMSKKKTVIWGSGEAEIAQWGGVPAERIVGFTHVAQTSIPDGPIFIRRSFRHSEPKAFEHMFNVMSGWVP